MVKLFNKHFVRYSKLRGSKMTHPELLKQISEKQFLQDVRDFLRLSGWLTYHTLRSKGSEPGFPDLVGVRPPRVVFIELKREDGVLTPAQKTWNVTLWMCPGVERYVFKPSMWDDIEALLR